MNGRMAYVFKDGTRHAVTAEIAADEINRIRDEEGEFFTPAAIVSASRSANAPLHPEFEWNDARAAEQYRQEQAAYLIRSIAVVYPDEPERAVTRAFVSVQLDNHEHRYTTMHHAMSDSDLREKVLAQALSDMTAFQRRYDQFLDLSGVRSAFDRARAAAERQQPPQQMAG